MKLIGVAGQKYSGKDTFAKALEPEWKHKKFAGPLKGMLRVLLSNAGFPSHTIDLMIDGQLKETPHEVLCGTTPRHAMQTLGTEWRDMIGKELWTNIMRWSLLSEPQNSYVISDVRFHHEVEMIHSLGGKVVLLRRGEWNCDPHPSEAEVPFLAADTIFLNNGNINELREFAKSYARGL